MKQIRTKPKKLFSIPLCIALLLITAFVCAHSISHLDAIHNVRSDIGIVCSGDERPAISSTTAVKWNHAAGDTMSGEDASGTSISGTVYQSDGITPMTGKTLWIYAYTGTPCGSVSRAGYASVDKSTGTYTIDALPSGTYYLRSNSSFFIKENILDEWWASPKSVRDCAEAQPVVVTEGQPVTGKDFQLEPGAVISGMVYHQDGVTPITGKVIDIGVYTGSPCGSISRVGHEYVDITTGAYTIKGLPSGTYYLRTSASGNYVDEWWASPKTVVDCTNAQPVAAAEPLTVTGINFQLERNISQVLGAWSDGVWIWNASTRQWTMMASTSNAAMIASGKIDNDSIEDLVGVWLSGLYVRKSSDGQWLKLSTSLPVWITTGDLDRDGKDDVIGSWANDGVYVRDSSTGQWKKLSSPAKQLAAGNIGGTRDDLAGVWSDGLWVRYSADASWKKIDASLPIWITTADMTGSGCADIVGSYSSGTWYCNSATSTWTKITTPADQLASGDINGDGREDLIGVWSSTVWVQYGGTGKWQQIAASKPRWITTGNIAEAVQISVDN